MLSGCFSVNILLFDLLSLVMKVRHVRSIFFLLMLVLSSQAFAREKEGKIDMFLKVDCPEKVYIDQTAVYSIYLYSDYKDIGGVEEIGYPALSRFEVFQGRVSQHAEKVKVKGKEYLRWNVGRYYFIPSMQGKFTITGGSYAVAVGTPTVVNDFFWGPMRSMAYETVRLKAPDVKVTVANLGKAPDDFSNAIGDFEVDCVIPPGELHEDVAAVAVFSVFGEGQLQDAYVIDLEKYFGPGARLKSINRSDDTVERDGRIISEIVVECTFIPLKPEGEIAPIPFTYFDVKTGKYRTIHSKAVKWKCGGESRRNPSTPLPSMDI